MEGGAKGIVQKADIKTRQLYSLENQASKYHVNHVDYSVGSR